MAYTDLTLRVPPGGAPSPGGPVESLRLDPHTTGIDALASANHGNDRPDPTSALPRYARAALTARVALTGTLSDLPLGDLLAWVGSADPLGVVELSGGAAGTIVLVDGHIALASADDGPTLEQMVIGSGAISAEGWAGAHAAVRAGRDLADALVDEGADPERLDAALREQTVGALFEFLVPGETAFAYLPGATHALGGRFAFDPAEVIDEALARVAAWKVIAEAIPSTSATMRLARQIDPPSIAITAEDWRILALVDGRSTVADIINDLGMSAFAVCGVLHRLMISGAVEIAE